MADKTVDQLRQERDQAAARGDQAKVSELDQKIQQAETGEQGQ